MKKRGVSRLFVQNFCLTVPKIFLGEQFSSSEKLSKKFFAWEGDITILCRKFLSHSTEKLRKGSLLFHKTCGIEKKLWIRVGGGSITIFCQNFFVSQCRKISKRNLSVLCFRKFPVAKKFMDKRGGGVSRFPVENFWSHSAEKFHRGTL